MIREGEDEAYEDYDYSKDLDLGPRRAPEVAAADDAAPTDEDEEDLDLAYQAAARALRGQGGPAGSVRYSRALAQQICTRVARGEAMRAVCAEPDMPHRDTVRRWVETTPRFAAALAAARRTGGWNGESRRPVWCPQTAQEICMRLGEGETLTAICSDPVMPSLSTVHRWRADRAPFDAMVRLAREAAAERVADQAMEIALAAKPEAAPATRVTLAHLRWAAARLGPRDFGAQKAVEPPKGPELLTTLLRHFQVEQREDGMIRVVGFTPDPETMQPVRDRSGPWERPFGNWVVQRSRHSAGDRSGAQNMTTGGVPELMT